MNFAGNWKGKAKSKTQSFNLEWATFSVKAAPATPQQKNFHSNSLEWKKVFFSFLLYFTFLCAIRSFFYFLPFNVLFFLFHFFQSLPLRWFLFLCVQRNDLVSTYLNLRFYVLTALILCRIQMRILTFACEKWQWCFMDVAR